MTNDSVEVIIARLQTHFGYSWLEHVLSTYSLMCFLHLVVPPSVGFELA